MAQTNQVEPTQGPVPAAIKDRSRDNFFQQKNFGSITGDDLYWILYRAASEQSSLGGFISETKQLLDDRLGAGNYLYTMSMAIEGHGGTLTWGGPMLTNTVTWAGDAGVLPAVGGTTYATHVVVSWR